MNTEKTLTLHLGNIPQEVNRTEIAKYFTKFGSISQIQIPMKDKTKKVNMGFAFLRCENSKMINQILKEGHKHKLRNSPISVREYLGQQEINTKFDLSRDAEQMIYLENVPPLITNQDLFQFFSDFGEVVEAAAIRGLKRDRRIFYGYVRFGRTATICKIPKKQICINGETINWRRFRRKRSSENSPSKKKLMIHKNLQSGLEAGTKRSPMMEIGEIEYSKNERDRKCEKGRIDSFKLTVSIKAAEYEKTHNFCNLRLNRDFFPKICTRSLQKYDWRVW